MRERRRNEETKLRSSRDDLPKKAALSLEEQIKLLEMEIEDSDEENISDSSENDSDNDSEETSDKEDADNEGDTMVYEKDDKGNIIRIISKIYGDKIEPLSEAQLPKFMCSKGSKQKPSFNLLKQLKPLGDEKMKSKTVVRFADQDNDEENKNKGDDIKEIKEEELELEEAKKKLRQEKKEKKKRPRNEEEAVKLEDEILKKTRISGLEKTVRELLQNYIPQSIEKKAFFCRICRVESVDLESFELHKLSELHTVAIKIEKKMSFCNLCRKQFTSPNQLREHVMGKGHKEYLSITKEKQLEQKNMKKFR